MLSHCNGDVGKAFKKVKTTGLFYLKGSEYIPLYQWQQVLLREVSLVEWNVSKGHEYD